MSKKNVLTYHTFQKVAKKFMYFITFHKEQHSSNLSFLFIGSNKRSDKPLLFIRSKTVLVYHDVL